MTVPAAGSVDTGQLRKDNKNTLAYRKQNLLALRHLVACYS